LKDFLSRTGQTVEIPPGSLSVPVAVTTCMDFNTEPNETFNVILKTVTNGDKAHDTGVGRLNNDD
jgi:hypothetical protein